MNSARCPCFESAGPGDESPLQLRNLSGHGASGESGTLVPLAEGEELETNLLSQVFARLRYGSLLTLNVSSILLLSVITFAPQNRRTGKQKIRVRVVSCGIFGALDSRKTTQAEPALESLPQLARAIELDLTGIDGTSDHPERACQDRAITCSVGIATRANR